MVVTRKLLYGLFASISVAGAVIFKPQNEFQELSGSNASFAVELGPWFNNRAFGMKPNESSFDGGGSE